MKALYNLGTKEATNLFINTAKQLIEDNLESAAKELTGVKLKGKTYSMRIEVSVFETTEH
tara:strand:- start:1113 stop:1292 length:180 start_codon:yes stop_codon:yes gene_type:complete